MAIPIWTTTGVLPPINQVSPVSANRSPYTVTLTDLILHFNTSKERNVILDGFLRFRAELHKLGVTQGFHWVDGSFLENIEEYENRAPRDIDVVTFYKMPVNLSQKDLLRQNPIIFNPQETKKNYNVDAYFVQLDTTNTEALVKTSAYWYSLWSHRRSGEWKGFLTIDLSPTDDTSATANLSVSNLEGQL